MSLLDDDLFGGFEIERTAKVQVSSARRGIEGQVTAAWEYWCDLTRRPDRDVVNRQFAKAVRAYLRQNCTSLPDILRGAAALPPRSRDPHDVHRATRAIESARTRRLALSAISDPIIPFPVVEASLRSSIEDLEMATGVSRRLWQSTDFDAAAVLLDAHAPDEILKFSHHAARLLAVDDVYPSEVLRHASSVGTLKVASRGERDNYQAGRTEADLLRDVALSADPDARRHLMSGALAEWVAAFHHEAPEGYWSAVLDALDEDLDADAADVHDRLGGVWDWHPSEREWRH